MDKLMLVGEVAKLCGVSSDTVRGWERRGILHAAVKTPTGCRLFRERDVVRFLAVREERRRDRELVHA